MIKIKFAKKQLIEAGIVFVILILLLDAYIKSSILLGFSIIMLFLDLVFPTIFYPVALIWFNLSEILGIFFSKIILGIIFFIIVVPVGIFRKFFAEDNLLLNKFNKDNSSVLKTRNYTYQSKDFDKPF